MNSNKIFRIFCRLCKHAIVDFRNHGVSQCDDVRTLRLLFLGKITRNKVIDATRQGLAQRRDANQENSLDGSAKYAVEGLKADDPTPSEVVSTRGNWRDAPKPRWGLGWGTIKDVEQGTVKDAGYVVQVASQRSDAEAQASFKTLQSIYPDVLGGRSPLIRRVDTGDHGIYYRAQVGPFDTIDQANRLCASLKAAGGQCIVQKN